MAGVNKKVADSISVKMMNFAKDIYYGMTKPSAKKLANDFSETMMKQGKKIDAKSIKNITDVYEKELAERATSIGYKAGDFLTRGTRNSYAEYKSAVANYKNLAANKATAEELLKNRPSVVNSIKKGHMNGDLIDKGAVAGTFVTASTAARFATGGGLYRDQYGNANIVGVPFI